MKSVAVVLAAMCLVSLVAAVDGPFNCTAIVLDDAHGKAYSYDLSRLYHEPQLSDSLYYQDPLTTELTYVNLCGTTTTQCSPSSPVCKRSGLWSTMGFGDLYTQQIVLIEAEGVDSGKGVTVHYSQGEYCPGSAGTSSTINVLCGDDEAVTDVSLSKDGCSIVITIKSQAGCGTPETYPGGAGDTFAIVLLILIIVGVILYIGIGMIVNWKVKGATTVREMIPQNEFWCALPGMIVDGCKFIAHGCKKGDYVSV